MELYMILINLIMQKILSITYDYDCLSMFVLTDFCQDINSLRLIVGYLQRGHSCVHKGNFGFLTVWIKFSTVCFYSILKNNMLLILRNQIGSLISFNSLPKPPRDLNAQNIFFVFYYIFFFSSRSSELWNHLICFWHVVCRTAGFCLCKLVWYFGRMIVGTVSRYILSFSAVYKTISDQNLPENNCLVQS